MKAVITDTEIADPDIEVSILEDAGFTVEVAQCKSASDVIAAAGDADALLVQYAPIDAQVLAALPRLRMVSRYGIGVDTIDLGAARRHGVWVSNVPEYGHDEVPTHAIAMLFALMRHLPFHDRAVRGGTWHFLETGPVEPLSQAVLGVVGMGRLGRFTARLAAPFFAGIVGYDPHLPEGAWPEGVERLSLEAVAERSSAITLHLPLTAETQAMIDRPLLERLRPQGAFLVNTARGGLIDLDAVLWALDHGRLKGAALDVLPSEPPSMDHPILHHPRTLITPHAAWYSTSSIIDLRSKYARNVAQWAKTGSAPNAVCVGDPRV